MASPYQDANGNLTYDGVHNYTYNAENRITKVDSGTTYSYGADGSRVSKVVSWVETDYVRDLSGNVLVEYGGGCGSTCASAEYLYLNGGLTAIYKNSTTYFVHPDHLGSTRLMTAMNQSIYENIDYLPFGEQIAGASNTTHKFTGYERDAESGNDYAMARYDSSRIGRFMSPDPVGNFVGDPTSPQTWNLYPYVANNPLSFVDPYGEIINASPLSPCCGGGGGGGWNAFEVMQLPVLLGTVTTTGMGGYDGESCGVSLLCAGTGVGTTTTYVWGPPVILALGGNQSQGGGTAGASGGAANRGTQQTQSPKQPILVCAAETANKYGLAQVAGTNGKSGFFNSLANGVLSNTFSTVIS